MSRILVSFVSINFIIITGVIFTYKKPKLFLFCIGEGMEVEMDVKTVKLWKIASITKWMKETLEQNGI